MTALAFPFHVDGTGRIGSVNTKAREVSQLIVVCATTIIGEQVMRPTRGGNVSAFVFRNARDLEDDRNVLREQLANNVPEAEIRDLTLEQEDATLFVGIAFTLAEEIDGDIFTVSVSVTGQAEESR